MEIVDIIKESFIFPSKNLENLVMYIVVRFIFALLLFGAITGASFAVSQNHFPVVGAVLIIFTLIAEFIIRGYKLSILKSGINREEDAPRFVWKNDLINGIKMMIVFIVYLIVPVIVVIISAIMLNIPAQAHNILQKQVAAVTNVSAQTNAATFNAIPQSSIDTFMVSISIVFVIALILYIIFSFLETMGESRLANTGSLGEALNIVESYKDIRRIGVAKVIGVILFVAIIIFIILTVWSYIYHAIPELSILTMVLTSYLIFFAKRANGLLYSDIA